MGSSPTVPTPITPCPAPAIALITERRVDSLDVCQQLAQREFFYIESRFHAAEKREPEHTLSTSSFAVLAPFEPGLARLNQTYHQVGMKAAHCSRAELAEYRTLLNEISAWCGQRYLPVEDRVLCRAFQQQPPAPSCSTTLPPVEVAVDAAGVMLFRTYGASYYEKPDEPHFYGVAWLPRGAGELATR